MRRDKINILWNIKNAWIPYLFSATSALFFCTMMISFSEEPFRHPARVRADLRLRGSQYLMLAKYRLRELINRMVIHATYIVEAVLKPLYFLSSWLGLTGNPRCFEWPPLSSLSLSPQPTNDAVDGDQHLLFSQTSSWLSDGKPMRLKHSYLSPLLPPSLFHVWEGVR